MSVSSCSVCFDFNVDFFIKLSFQNNCVCFYFITRVIKYKIVPPVSFCDRYSLFKITNNDSFSSSKQNILDLGLDL